MRVQLISTDNIRMALSKKIKRQKNGNLIYPKKSYLQRMSTIIMFMSGTF